MAEITISGGKATGIRLASGETHTATKAVIAGVAPGALASKLLPNGSGDAGFDTAMKKFRHAPGTMMIHLALDDLPDWKAGAELKKFAYVHIAPSLDQMARTYSRPSQACCLTSRCWSSGSRQRSIRRALLRQACSVGAGAHAARRDPRRRGGRDRASVMG